MPSRGESLFGWYDGSLSVRNLIKKRREKKSRCGYDSIFYLLYTRDKKGICFRSPAMCCR